MEHTSLQYTIEGAPDYAFIDVKLPQDTIIKVEASSMATMDTNIEMKTKFKGGLSRFLTGESIFINEFKTKMDQEELVSHHRCQAT